MAKKKLYDEHGNEVKGKIKKPFYKKVWFWAVIVILFFMFIQDTDDISDTVADNTTPSASSSIEESDSVEKEEEVETVGIGQKVSVSDVEYVVNEVTTTDYVGSEFIGETAQGTFLVVNVTVTNNGNESLDVSNDFFTLVNGDKRYDSNTSASIYASDSDQSFFVNSINPELSLTGNVVFDVSQTVIDSQTKQLEVQTGYWGTETGLINLQ